MWEWAVDNWKWLTGPVVLAVLYYVTGDRTGRRAREVEAWRAARSPKKGEPTALGKPGAKKLSELPAEIAALVENVGGGTALATFELAPKLAYLAVMNADVVSGSDHQTIVAKLDGPPLAFTARPLPVVDGARAAQTGIEFKKDPEFNEQFLVEGADAKAVKKWLIAPIRQAMLDLPDVWLTVRGRMMALTLFGPADAAQLEELVVVADTMFGEHGAGGAPSLIGEEFQDDDAENDESDSEEQEAKAPAADAGAEAPRTIVVKATTGKAGVAQVAQVKNKSGTTPKKNG